MYQPTVQTMRTEDPAASPAAAIRAAPNHGNVCTPAPQAGSTSLPPLTLLFVPLVLVACGGATSSGPTVALRDSAGVSIVENRGELPEGGGGWAVAPEPSLRIGAMEGDENYLLFRPWGAVRLSDGRIAVANNRAPDVRVFSPTGEHLHTFGSRGEGPGEFDSPVLIGVLPGDTLVVVDRRLRRVNLFHPDEGFIRGSTADPSIEGFLLTVGMFSSGSVVIQRSSWTVEMPNGYYRFPIRYLSVGLNGKLEQDLGEYPGNETAFATQAVGEGTTVLSVGTPFGKNPMTAVSGEHFFYGSQDTYEIRVVDRDGRLVRLIRRDKAPVGVTDAHVAAVMEDMLDDAQDSNQEREFRRLFRDSPIPENHPAYGSIHADRLGCLWVEETRVPDGPEARLTTIFDPDGRMVGSVVLPEGLLVWEIGEDYVLGRTVDDLGVPYLQLHELTRPSPPE